jgi:hypothetical protein
MDIAATTLLRYMRYSIVALAAESVSRHTAIWVEPPTLAPIFDAEREMRAMRRAADGA